MFEFGPGEVTGAMIRSGELGPGCHGLEAAVPVSRPRVGQVWWVLVWLLVAAAVFSAGVLIGTQLVEPVQGGLVDAVVVPFTGDGWVAPATTKAVA